jgi:pyruvate kinase
MHTSKQPTRAEVTDVANAIHDGADACMLSGETAIGEYPVEAVQMMNKIMTETEKSLSQQRARMRSEDYAAAWEISDAVIFGAAHIANRIHAKMVVIASRESEIALIKSKQRDLIPTICITDHASCYRRMSLFWGVTPVLCSTPFQQDELLSFINQWASSNHDLQSGDHFVVVTDTDLLPGVHDSVLVAQIA